MTRYHEDLVAGQRVVHRRGHTVSESDNQFLSLLTMNTAQTHFNHESMATYMDGAFPRPLLNACVALGLAVGLTSEDLTENALADLAIDDVRMPAPVFVGDTLHVESGILATDGPSPRPDAGVLVYALRAHKTVDGAPVTVLHATRTVLVKRAASWRERDAAHRRARRPQDHPLPS